MNKISITEEMLSNHLSFLKKRRANVKDINEISKNSYYKCCVFYTLLDECTYEESTLSPETKLFVREYLIREFDNIITAKPAVLLEIEEKLYRNLFIINKKKLSDELLLKETNKILFKIFDYDKFKNTKNLQWNPHIFTESLKITVCPYCNTQFAYTINNNGYKIRPTLDHYFPQSHHPLLSVSLYNLVPSCTICNSSLKGSDNMNLAETYHPYLDEINKQFIYKREIGKNENNENSIDYYSQILGEETGYAILAVEKQDKEELRVKTYNQQFALTNRLEQLSPYINNEIRKHLKLRRVYTESLRNSYKINISPNDVLNTELNNDFNNKLLLKILNDIFLYEFEIF